MSHFKPYFYSLCVLLLAVATVHAEPLLEAVDSVGAGSEITITLTEKVEDTKDYVTIVEKDAAEGAYARYVYPKDKTTIKLTAPEISGTYEIRLLDADSKRQTIVSRDLEVTEVTATLTAPSEIDAGAQVKIAWEGPGNRGDFITIVPSGSDEGKYNKYQYTKSNKRKQEVSITAPEEPGDFEIRYLTGGNRYTLASSPLVVKEVTATLDIPNQIAAGEVFEIKFSGPNNKTDFITIVEKGADEGTYKKYKYVRNHNKRNPLKLPAPDLPGEYEVRYLTGDMRFTLASAPIQVGGTTATLEAEEEIVEGGELVVNWTGPDNPKDFITIVKEDAEEGAYANYAYTRKKFGPRKLKQVSITAPEESGKYEIRYLTGEKRFTIGSKKLVVNPPSASLGAPEEAIAKDVVSVTWEGPGNKNDFVAFKAIEGDYSDSGRYAYVRRGKTLKLNTPDTPGKYLIQYLTGGKRKVLASREILITPSKVPGKLSVVQSANAETESLSADAMNVALILDASGSMLKRDQGGKNRIDVAKSAIQDLVNGPLSKGTPFTMRVFGHKEKDSCRTDLEVALAPLDQSAVTQKVKNINAMNYAKTPIAKSLELVKEDLAAAEGKRVVILVTDGEETCGGDPKAAIEELAKSGFETRVNIVGFAIDEYMLKETFRSWARLGNGNYFDASNPEELIRSLKEAVRVPYEVLNSKQELISSGVVNGEPLSILPGTYTIKVLSSPARLIETVVVEPEQLKTIDVSSGKASS